GTTTTASVAVTKFGTSTTLGVSASTVNAPNSVTLTATVHGQTGAPNAFTTSGTPVTFKIVNPNAPTTTVFVNATGYTVNTTAGTLTATVAIPAGSANMYFGTNTVTATFNGQGL